jgi:hypothetical protein
VGRDRGSRARRPSRTDDDRVAPQRHPTSHRLVGGLFAGLVLGAIWGAIVQAFSGGRQDFASIRGLEAGRYDVLVDEPHAEAARMILRPALGR